MGVEPYLINSSLICVVAQRLIRKICPSCREPNPIKKDILDSLKLNIDNVKKPEFFRGKGCSQCFNIGYAGRTVIAEVLLLTTQIRDLILARAQEHIIKQEARKEGMKTLREDGVEMALKGITTLEEILRVTAADE
jgi:type II secretory ATPase GspE/PulE/Tfp pilus assembly ATPase PilB-like protein